MNLREIYVRERLRQGQVGQAEEESALYSLREILVFKDLTPEHLRQVHRAKLAYPGVRLIQDGNFR